MNPQDEIEMELGGKTLKIGDKVRTIDGQQGVILGVMRATDEASHRHLFDVYDVENTRGSYFGWQLTPVEPEGVKERVEWITVYGACPCCGYYEARHATPDHTYAQRVGMLERDIWFVLGVDVDGHTYLSRSGMTEDEARAWLRECSKVGGDWERRMFRWSSGLRG